MTQTKKSPENPGRFKGQLLQALPARQIELATIVDFSREMAQVYRGCINYSYHR
jgi:hypothetical protein